MMDCSLHHRVYRITAALTTNDSRSRERMWDQGFLGKGSSFSSSSRLPTCFVRVHASICGHVCSGRTGARSSIASQFHDVSVSVSTAESFVSIGRTFS